MIRASRIRRYLPGKHSLNTKVPLQVSGQKKTPSQCKVAFVKHTLHHIYVPAAKKNIYSSRYELGCSKKHNVSGQARHLCGSIANSPPQPKKQRTDHSRDDVNLKLYHPGYRLGSWQPELGNSLVHHQVSPGCKEIQDGHKGTCKYTGENTLASVHTFVLAWRSLDLGISQ